MPDSQSNWTLKEIDQSRGATKGTAFRAFKQLQHQLVEGRDFHYLNGADDPATLARLKQAGRLYDSSAHVLLFCASGQQAICHLLDAALSPASAKPGKDDIFSRPRPHLVDFAFDEQVAQVFPDMIRRSVPGYDAVIAMLGVFAHHFVQPHSRIYDLGCSQGAATLALRRHIRVPDVKIVAIDNAPAMIERCRQNVAADLSPAEVEVRCQDILQTPIENASLVALNFTLQFVPPEQRDGLVAKIFHGLNAGGVLLLSEKICFDTEAQQTLFTELHHDFKRLNGYSDLEISQKRQSIENVLIPETPTLHEQRLRQQGFSRVHCWFQCFNFISLVAIK